MSARNTGLFVTGHVDPAEVGAVFWTHPTVGAAALSDEEAPRVGHGERDGKPFSLVALRLFELGGVLLLESGELVGEDDLERELGRALSSGGRTAVFLHYDEERGAGGHALFRDGKLVDRQVVDGKQYQPVVRDLAGERPFEVADEEAWIWEAIGDAVEAGATAVLGPGVRTDDDLEAIIESVTLRSVDRAGSLGQPERGRADGFPADGLAHATEGPGEPAPLSGLRGLLRRLAGRG